MLTTAANAAVNTTTSTNSSFAGTSGSTVSTSVVHQHLQVQAAVTNLEI